LSTKHFKKDVRLTADEILGDIMAGFFADPLGYVMFNFPWGKDSACMSVPLHDKYRERFPNCEFGPDLWQCEYLDQWGEEIRKRGFNGRDAVDRIHFSTASGHGIGKSVLVAFIIMFIMDTRPHCKGTVTASTQDQLKSKTWAELGKWWGLSTTKHLYEYSNSRGSMSFKRKGYIGSWFVNGQTSKEENSESFAGQHAANSTSFYIFDEASGVPDKIFEVREGGMATGEPMMFDFGNPTKNSGMFFENHEGKFKDSGIILRAIDSRLVHITNKNDIESKRKLWGEESDFFKVRVRGVFPSKGSVQFMDGDQVLEAMRRPDINHSGAWSGHSVVLGVDPARFGDDESVIYPRVGMDARSFPAIRMNGLDTVQLTGKVIEQVRYFRGIGMKVAAIFVDGTGLGGGVVDQLRHLGYPVYEIGFGWKPNDPKMYRYRGDEMWDHLKTAVATRLLLPQERTRNGDDLRTQLTQREYGYTLSGQINLESKKDMKERLGSNSSPDIADALALTFAMEIAPDDLPAGEETAGVVHEYDPMNSNW
jgi:hypothetical protein